MFYWRRVSVTDTYTAAVGRPLAKLATIKHLYPEMAFYCHGQPYVSRVRKTEGIDWHCWALQCLSVLGLTRC